MKGCLVCFSEADDSAVSCPRCGEATWTQPFPSPLAETMARIERPAFTAESKPVKKARR